MRASGVAVGIELHSLPAPHSSSTSAKTASPVRAWRSWTSSRLCCIRLTCSSLRRHTVRHQAVDVELWPILGAGSLGSPGTTIRTHQRRRNQRPQLRLAQDGEDGLFGGAIAGSQPPIRLRLRCPMGRDSAPSMPSSCPALRSATSATPRPASSGFWRPAVVLPRQRPTSPSCSV